VISDVEERDLTVDQKKQRSAVEKGNIVSSISCGERGLNTAAFRCDSHCASFCFVGTRTGEDFTDATPPGVAFQFNPETNYINRGIFVAVDTLC
jgi:hypothetical protein